MAYDMGAPNVEYLAKKIENEVHSVLKKISSNGTQNSMKVCHFMKSKRVGIIGVEIIGKLGISRILHVYVSVLAIYWPI